MRRKHLVIALALAMVVVLAVAGAFLAGRRSGSGQASQSTTALPLGVSRGPQPGTFYVDCSVVQCTSNGPFGTTCLSPSAGTQLCGPPSAVAATTPPASAPPAGTYTAQCQMGYVNVPAGDPANTDVSQKTFQLIAPNPAPGFSLSDYKAMQVTVTASGGDATVSGLGVDWYDSSGNKIGSVVDLGIGGTIPDGQSQTYVYDETYAVTSPPAGAATCQVTENNTGPM